jgi:hypothetical protein
MKRFAASNMAKDRRTIRKKETFKSLPVAADF